MSRQEIERAGNMDLTAPGVVERLTECYGFARQHGLMDNLMLNLDRLEGLAGKGTVRLYLDFEPLSFIWVLEDGQGNHRMTGGMIYHGPVGDTYGGTSSVQLTPSVGWQLHS